MSKVTRKTLVRWLSLFAALVLCVAGFAGCGGPANPSSEPTSETEVTTTGGETAPTDPGESTDPADPTETENPGGDILRTTESGGGAKTTTTELPQPTVPPTEQYDFLANFPSELSGQTISMLTWFAPDDVLLKQIEDFKAKTGITVKINQTTWGNYTAKIASLVGSNMSPDIASIQPDWWPSLIINKYFQEITVGDFDLENDPAYDRFIMDRCSWGGKYYGVAVKNSTWCSALHLLFYNKAIFQRNNVKTPTDLWIEGNWNWDTYLEAAKALTKTVDGVNYYGTQVLPTTYMLSAGTDFVKFETSGNNTKIVNNLNDPKLEMAWKFYIQPRSVDKVEPMSTADNAFFNGTLAMVVQEDYYLLEGRGMEKMTDPWGVVPFPSPKGQEEVLASSVKIWGIPTGSKPQKARAASYFIRYFLDPNTEVGGKKFISDEAEQVCQRASAMNKNALLSLGVIGYNTDSDFWSLFSDVAYGELDQVKTNLLANENKVNGIIETLERAMSY